MHITASAMMLKKNHLAGQIKGTQIAVVKCTAIVYLESKIDSVYSMITIKTLLPGAYN